MMHRSPRGYLLLLGLVFGAIFLTVLGSLAGFVLMTNKAQTASTDRAKAFSIAEAGLEYYRWFLAHNPGDITNGTGQPGPYLIPYNDPEAALEGTITLDIEGNTQCGELTSIDINATGQPEGSNVSRTLTVRYTRPSVALFSYILNDSVWAGADRIINGPYHSNGGIRMDGTANAPVTSSVETWPCTTTFGCSPTQTKAGVWGAGPNQTLWSFPVPQVDFAGISADFGTLKTVAQSEGVYLPRFSTGNSNGAAYWHGYHLIFNADGTITVRRVTSTTQLNVTPVNPADGSSDRALIQNETFYQTITPPANCKLLFVEDHVWIEGTVSDKYTVVAANVTTSGIEPNAYLRGNTLYQTTDGSDGLTVIAERNVLITPDSPETMVLNGIFIAQGGAFGRNYYSSSCSTSYESKPSLTIRGTTVSNKRTGTKWTNACSSYAGYGGYNNRVDAYDRQLATDPPAFTPVVSNDYQFVDWREE